MKNPLVYPPDPLTTPPTIPTTDIFPGQSERKKKKKQKLRSEFTRSLSADDDAVGADDSGGGGERFYD